MRRDRRARWIEGGAYEPPATRRASCVPTAISCVCWTTRSRRDNARVLRRAPRRHATRVRSPHEGVRRLVLRGGERVAALDEHPLDLGEHLGARADDLALDAALADVQPQ